MLNMYRSLKPDHVDDILEKIDSSYTKLYIAMYLPLIKSNHFDSINIILDNNARSVGPVFCTLMYRGIYI